MRYFLRDQGFIPAHGQPAVLLDLAREQGIDINLLLRHTGLFPPQLEAGNARISCQDFLQVIHNTRRQLPDSELAFRFGQRLFPGHYGAASNLLANAGNLQQALQVFSDFAPLITPLAQARIRVTERHLCVQWVDSTGAGQHWRFITEAMMTALASVTSWLAGQRLPWQFQFSYPRPDYPEQYQVNLGDRLHFSAQLDAMFLPRPWLEKPWPRGSATAWRVALSQSREELGRLPGQQSLRQALYNFMAAHVDRPPSLQESAHWLGCSPATLKRRLREFGCRYQQLLDEARLHQAVHWLVFQGDSPDQVCRKLNFSDSTNFRRSFKRWSGQTPAACHKQLQALGE